MTSKNKKQKSKGSRVLLGFLIVLLAAGLCTGGAIATINYLSAKEQIKIKDSAKLICGVEKLHDNVPVGIFLELKDEETILYSSTYWSNTTDMAQQDGQPEDLVFHDYTEEISSFVGTSIFQWVNSSTGYLGHKIIIQTIALDGAIRSSDFYVADSGIYFVGVALKNGEEPCTSSYAAIYHGNGG